MNIKQTIIPKYFNIISNESSVRRTFNSIPGEAGDFECTMFRFSIAEQSSGHKVPVVVATLILISGYERWGMPSYWSFFGLLDSVGSSWVPAGEGTWEFTQPFYYCALWSWRRRWTLCLLWGMVWEYVHGLFSPCTTDVRFWSVLLAVKRILFVVVSAKAVLCHQFCS